MAVDVSTACHLGTCIAVRAAEAVPLLNSNEDRAPFSCSQLESALCISGLGKRSKQRFLKSSCTDSIIQRSRRGAGGNTVSYSCFIVQQSEVDPKTVDELREGTYSSLYQYSLKIIVYIHAALKASRNHQQLMSTNTNETQGTCIMH